MEFEGGMGVLVWQWEGICSPLTSSLVNLTDIAAWASLKAPVGTTNNAYK